MSQHSLDQFVLELFENKSGFYIEAGGSHPTDQNNTHLLEVKGWKGLIVEPLTTYNESYRTVRPNTILENYALVSFDYKKETIKGNFSNVHMGGCTDSPLHRKDDSVPCITLAALLEKHNIKKVNFFSLDVEGYEKEVLKGIDFSKVDIDLIILEAHCYTKEYQEENNFFIDNDFSFLEDFGFVKKIDKISAKSQIGHISHLYYVNKNSNIINKF